MKLSDINFIRRNVIDFGLLSPDTDIILGKNNRITFMPMNLAEAKFIRNQLAAKTNFCRSDFIHINSDQFELSSIYTLPVDKHLPTGIEITFAISLNLSEDDVCTYLWTNK
jgi:hypothetical protein